MYLIRTAQRAAQGLSLVYLVMWTASLAGAQDNVAVVSFEPFVSRSYEERVAAFVDKELVAALYAEEESEEDTDSDKWRRVLIEEKEFDAIRGEAERRLSAVTDSVSFGDYVSFIDYVYGLARRDDDKHFDALVEEWIAHDPNVWIPYWVRGQKRFRDAWDARGTGFVDTVDGDQWDEFFRLMNLANGDFAKCRELKPEDPYSAIRLIGVGKCLQLSPKQQRQVYQQAIELAPFSNKAHIEYLQTLYPKWSGTWELAESFVDRVMRDFDKEPWLLLVKLDLMREQRGLKPGYEKLYENEQVIAETLAQMKVLQASTPESDWAARETYVWARRAKDYATMYEMTQVIGNKFTPFSTFDTKEKYHYQRMYTLLNHQKKLEGEARVKVLDEMMTLAPDWPEVWREYGLYYVSQENIEEASRYLRRAIELGTDNYYACFYAIRYASMRKDYREALAYVEYAESLDLKDSTRKIMQTERERLQSIIDSDEQSRRD